MDELAIEVRTLRKSFDDSIPKTPARMAHFNKSLTKRILSVCRQICMIRSGASILKAQHELHATTSTTGILSSVDAIGVAGL